MTDPIADMLTRIRNAYQTGKKTTLVPYSRLKEAVLKVLTEEGFVDGYVVHEKEPQNDLEVTLKYVDSHPVVTTIERVSKPGRRAYTQSKTIKPILGGHGVAIVSTSQGVMTDKKAKSLNVGGEVICRVW